MKKLLLIPLLTLGLSACGDPASNAESVAVEFCENIASADFDMNDIASSNVTSAFQGLYEMNSDMYKRNISSKINCSVKNIEEVKSEKSYKVAFENMNTVLVSFDEKLDSFKVQRQWQMTSDLF
ncbi:MAG: hypothetical protein ACPGR2_13660 [Psychrobium sp.]